MTVPAVTCTASLSVESSGTLRLLVNYCQAQTHALSDPVLSEKKLEHICSSFAF